MWYQTPRDSGSFCPSPMNVKLLILITRSHKPFNFSSLSTCCFDGDAGDENRDRSECQIWLIGQAELPTSVIPVFSLQVTTASMPFGFNRWVGCRIGPDRP